MATKNRIESNEWLKIKCGDIKGEVLSIGSLTDSDDEGGFYKTYFSSCDKYITSEVDSRYDCDINNLDICDMSELEDERFECVFCSGVLEHVIDFNKGIREMHRVIKPAGVLLLGVPFKQGIHMTPTDYWRFTKHGVEVMLDDYFHIADIKEIDISNPAFPGAYWVKAIKK